MGTFAEVHKQMEVERIEISRLKCVPGDIVVLKFPVAWQTETVINYGKYLSTIFPDLKFMFLPSDTEISILHPANIHDPFKVSTVSRDVVGLRSV
jgi:hypothetical protein